MTRSKLPRWGLPVLVLLLIAIPLLGLAVSSWMSQGKDALTTAALDYAGRQIIWNKGPNVISIHTTQLRDLPRLLATYASPRVASDVNVPGLLHRYGANLRVSVVILHGDFNSLPPSEGVTLHEVVVLVDTHRKTAFFLMD